MKKKAIYRGSWISRLLLPLVTIFMLYPVFWSVYSSFKTNAEFLGNPFSLPASAEWDNYIRAIQKSNIFSNLKNSVYVVVVSLILITFLVIPCSYCLARFRFLGKKLMQTMYMSMIFIQFSCIMIPLFLQMNSLHMLNRLTPLALIYAVMQVPFSVFLLIGFMQGIAREYEEAAMLDGCTWLRTLVSVIVPLAKPGVVTVLMLSAMAIWNEYIIALVMISDPAKQTVPVGVAAMYEVQRYATDWGALFAALVLVLLPTAVLYMAGQRYLTEGIGMGGLKG